MIAVKVADENTGDARRRQIRKDELPLRSFARIEEKSFVIPAQEIRSMIAKTGLLLARTSKNRKISHTHSLFSAFQAKNGSFPRRIPKRAPAMWAEFAMFGENSIAVKIARKKDTSCNANMAKTKKIKK